MAGQGGGGWRNWGDHPIIIAIGLVVSFITIVTFVTGRSSLRAILGFDDKLAVVPTITFTSVPTKPATATSMPATPTAVPPTPTNIPPTITTAPTIETPQTQPSTGFLSSINGSVTSLKFFESDKELTSKEQRVYQEQFDNSASKYICWELDLIHSPPGHQVNFIIHAIYYRSDGSILGEIDHQAYINADWKDSQHAKGWGYDELGRWNSGSYTVVLLVNGDEIARGSFTVH